MDIKEFNEKVGKVFGLKAGILDHVLVNANNDNHLDIKVVLYLKPTNHQAKKLREIGYEFLRVTPIAPKDYIK